MARFDLTNFKAKGIGVIVHEPVMQKSHFFNSRVANDLDSFKQEADLIAANRNHPGLGDARAKVFSREIFHES